MRRRNLLVVIWLGLGLACSSDPVAGGGADAGPDPGSDAPLGGGLTFTIDWGPVTVPGNTEDTRCVLKKLGNSGAAWIGALETHLTASHHLIVYRVPGTEERPDPYPCQPFLDTLDPESAGAPLMVSQIEEERLELPAGVAFGIEADQLVRLELHYVNYTDAEITVEAAATFVTLRPEEFQHEADFLFTGNPDIQLPQGVSTLGPTWFPLPDALEDVKIFGMTGHTHKWGTDVQVEHLTAKGAAGQMIYDYENWNWEEPPVARFEPALDMPAGAGFRFTCRWDNQSGRTVNFGESADDEMCFFWSYYYPSQGHKVCVHSDQYDDGAGEPGTDICCPGHPYCALIDDFLNM
jgi:hypothetical protein